MQLTDTLTIDGTARETRDGYLVANVRAARTGIQLYSGAEVGKPDMASVRVYRPEAEVMHKDAMASFTSLPITLDHPPEMVTPDNYRKYGRGHSGEEVARDGDFIRIPLMVKDAAAIGAAKSTHRQISMGYTTDLKWEPGTAPDGSAYDAIQTNIRANHIAIVPAARGGDQLRIGDSKPMKTIVHDGISIEFADQAADAYNSLKAKLDASTANVTKLTADIATRDSDLAKKDAEIDSLKAKSVTPAQLDAAVTKRADLIATARAISPNVVTDGKSEAEIKSAVVAAAGVTLDGKSADYIAARFDILAEDAKAHGKVNDALRTSQPTLTGQMAVDAAARKAAEDQNAWRTAKH